MTGIKQLTPEEIEALKNKPDAPAPGNFTVQPAEKPIVEGIKYKRHIKEPAGGVALDTSIENPMEVLKRTGLYREPVANPALEAAEAARAAVAGMSNTSGTKKAVVALADAVEAMVQ